MEEGEPTLRGVELYAAHPEVDKHTVHLRRQRCFAQVLPHRGEATVREVHPRTEGGEDLAWTRGGDGQTGLLFCEGAMSGGRAALGVV